MVSGWRMTLKTYAWDVSSWPHVLQGTARVHIPHSRRGSRGAGSRRTWWAACVGVFVERLRRMVLVMGTVRAEPSSFFLSGGPSFDAREFQKLQHPRRHTRKETPRHTTPTSHLLRRLIPPIPTAHHVGRTTAQSQGRVEGASPAGLAP
jgi:hypothetical protein